MIGFFVADCRWDTVGHMDTSRRNKPSGAGAIRAIAAVSFAAMLTLGTLVAANGASKVSTFERIASGDYPALDRLIAKFAARVRTP